MGSHSSNLREEEKRESKRKESEREKGFYTRPSTAEVTGYDSFVPVSQLPGSWAWKRCNWDAFWHVLLGDLPFELGEFGDSAHWRCLNRSLHSFEHIPVPYSGYRQRGDITQSRCRSHGTSLCHINTLRE